MTEQNETTNDIPNIWNDIAKRALRTGAHIPVVEEEFDREKALHGLHWNFGFNRRPKNNVIKKFSDVISDGTFASGSMLRIARNEDGEWVLIDGQHRLAAIASTNARVWMMVAIDERAANIAYASIDNLGTLRTGADSVSSILGWSTRHWTKVVSAGIIVRSGFSREAVVNGTYRFSSVNEKNEGIAEVLLEHKAELIKIVDATKNPNALRGPSLAVFIVAARYQPDKFWPFFTAAVKDDMLAKNSPEKRLAETFMLSARQSPDRLRLCIYTIMAWNSAYEGRDLPQFGRVACTGPKISHIPEILGTPYPM